jgi:transcription elongation factor Elf1
MNPIEEREVQCPYCGETISVLLDLSAGDQNYIEDCTVCCQPIEFSVRVDPDGGEAGVDVKPSDG